MDTNSTKKPLPKIVKFGCLPLAALFALILIIGVLRPGPKSTYQIADTLNGSKSIAVKDTAISSDTTAKKTPSHENNKAEEPSTSSWRYDQSVDRMDNTTTHWAMVTSPEKLFFQFPYDGGATIDLQIRKKGSRLDIYFFVSKGQFQTYNQAARLKFDDNAPIKVYLNDASDGSTEYAFINGPSSVLAKIKKSKSLIAELPFYGEGRKQVTFNIQNLEWNY